MSQDKEYCKIVWDERIERNLKVQQEYFDGKQDDKKEGIIEGKINTQKEIVINLYQKDIPLETISEYTNIPLDKINNIIKTIKE